MWKEIGPYIAPLAVFAVLIWRMQRNKASKVRLKMIWLSPLLVSAGVWALFSAAPPRLDAVTVAGFPLALAGGLALGWLRVRHMELAVDPEHGTLTSKATPLGMILIVALFGLKFGIKMAFPELAAQPGQAHLSAAAAQYTDIAILFSAGLVWARAVTLYLRARPLLAAHRAAAPASP